MTYIEANRHLRSPCTGVNNSQRLERHRQKEHIDHEQEAGMSIFKRGLRAASGATGRGNNNSHRGRSKSREDAKQRQQQQTTAKKDKADNNNETEGGEEGETGNSCSGAPKKPKQARSRNPLVGK